MPFITACSFLGACLHLPPLHQSHAGNGNQTTQHQGGGQGFVQPQRRNHDAKHRHQRDVGCGIACSQGFYAIKIPGIGHSGSGKRQGNQRPPGGCRRLRHVLPGVRAFKK